MKTFKLCSLGIILLIVTCCRSGNPVPVEGTWKMVAVYTQGENNPGAGNIGRRGLYKTWSREYFTWVGQSFPDTTVSDGYGAGTYNLEGNRYEEHIIFHSDTSLINKSFRALLEVHNDTLFQKYNSDHAVGDSYALRDGFITEVYVRVK